MKKKRTKKKKKLGGSSNIELKNFTPNKNAKKNDDDYYYLVERVYHKPQIMINAEKRGIKLIPPIKPILLRDIYFAFDDTLKVIEYKYNYKSNSNTWEPMGSSINYYIWTKGPNRDKIYEWMLFKNGRVDDGVGLNYIPPDEIIDVLKYQDSELGKYLRTRSTGNSKKIFKHIVDQIESNIRPLRPGNKVLSLLNNASKGRFITSSKTVRNKVS